MLLVDEWLLPLVVEEDMMGARDLDGVVGQSSCDDVDLRDILIPWGRCINRKLKRIRGIKDTIPLLAHDMNCQR